MTKKFTYLFREGNENMRELLGGKGANLAEMSNLGMPVLMVLPLLPKLVRSIMKMEKPLMKKFKNRSLNT